jgi:aryl-alcohol dehydrogenase-like predicted oxidoreductase
VLSRGLISSTQSTGPLAANDFRRLSPRFQGDNLDHNRSLVEQLTTIADDRGLTVAQLAIAWACSRGDDIVPLIGTTNPGRLAQAVAAAQVELTEDEQAAIEAVVPADAVAGDRYTPEQMAVLDSER